MPDQPSTTSEEEFNTREFNLMLIHAAICGITFIAPAEHLPPYMFDGSEDFKKFKTFHYANTHRMWTEIAFVGRRN